MISRRSVAGFAVLWLAVTVSHAGGDGGEGMITRFSGSDGSYQFHFEQTGPGHEFMAGCRSFDVSVRYARVPWYSWLPWVETLHPTFEQTETAAAFLRSAADEHRSVVFGYMGSGLVADGPPCSFVTKGLELIQIPSEPAEVWAYHNPV